MKDEIVDSLNRSAKLFIDNGSAATPEDAIRMLHNFRMHLVIGEAAACSATHQASLLTAVNCGRRTFLGGVTVSGALRAPLLSKVAPGITLGDAVGALCGVVVDKAPQNVPLISIGPLGIASPSSDFAIRTTFQGWRGGIVPIGAPGLDESIPFTTSGVLAGALAVAEVFAHLNGEPMAGYRPVGLSLWDPLSDWRDSALDGPMPSLLPADFWVIGLGHLGQAFLWTIGLLSFADPSSVRLFLQDDDDIGRSTESTSVLTAAADKGKLKTRVCSRWAEQCGFQSRLVERRFDRDLRVGYGEPLLALCGVDNPQARAILGGAGFASVFEAGLGAGVEDFRLIRTHSFPAPLSEAAIWSNDHDANVAPQFGVTGEVKLPAYEHLRASGDLDECGLTRLAGVAVGAPFVGMVAATSLISQITRFILDGRRPTVFNFDLKAPLHRRVVYHDDDADLVLFRTAAAAPTPAQSLNNLPAA